MKKSHKLSCLIFVCTTLFACNNQTNISSNSSTSVNSSEISSSSLVGENSSQNSSSINSSSSNSMEIFYKFLSEPNLQLNKENGLVTFSPIDGA